MYIPARLHPRLLGLNLLLHLSCINKNNLPRLHEQLYPSCIYPDSIPRLCTHVVYTLILCQDYIHVWRRLVLNWYSTKSSSTSVTASIYNAALYPEYTHNSTVLYTPWRYTQTTSTSLPLCFYTDTLHRVHLRPYPGTQPRLHLRHVRTHPVYTLTFKLDYIDSTKTSSNSVLVLLSNYIIPRLH